MPIWQRMLELLALFLVVLMGFIILQPVVKELFYPRRSSRSRSTSRSTRKYSAPTPSPPTRITPPVRRPKTYYRSSFSRRRRIVQPTPTPYILPRQPTVYVPPPQPTTPSTQVNTKPPPIPPRNPPVVIKALQDTGAAPRI